MKVFSSAGPLLFFPQSLLSELRNGGSNGGGSHSTFHILTHSMNLVVVNKSGAKRWEETLDSCQILSSVDSQCGCGADFNQGKVQNKEEERKSSLATNLSMYLLVNLISSDPGHFCPSFLGFCPNEGEWV